MPPYLITLFESDFSEQDRGKRKGDILNYFKALKDHLIIYILGSHLPQLVNNIIQLEMTFKLSHKENVSQIFHSLVAMVLS